MIVIVPLAGPDMIVNDTYLKCQKDFNGQPLIQYMLNSRAWSFEVRKYIFVFTDHTVARTFYSQHLKIWFPNSEAVYLSNFTNGAASSCLAALSLVKDKGENIIIDFAYIYFDCDRTEFLKLVRDDTISAFAPTFMSNLDIYSYLKFDIHNNFISAREKQVISNDASVAVYYFRNTSCYIKALIWLHEEGSDFTYNNLNFVCPLLNGVHANGGEIRKLAAYNVLDPKNNEYLSFSN